MALIVLWVGLYCLVRATRDLAWKYSQPEIKPAGIPVDLSHPMHPAPPPAASAPPSEAPKAGLVQIAPMNASAPATQETSRRGASCGVAVGREVVRQRDAKPVDRPLRNPELSGAVGETIGTRSFV